LIEADLTVDNRHDILLIALSVDFTLILLLEDPIALPRAVKASPKYLSSSLLMPIDNTAIFPLFPR
jgi:hypothetical protein